MRQRRRLLAALALAPLAARAQTPVNDDGWLLRIEDEASGLRLFQRPRPGGLPAFRVTARSTARLSALVAVLLDAEHMPAWVPSTRLVQRLRVDSPQRGVSRVVTELPGPLAARETLVAWRLEQDPQTLAVVYAGEPAPADTLAPSEGLVRMERFASQWLLQPLTGGGVDLRFEGHADLGGALDAPLWRPLLAELSLQVPRQTMSSLLREALSPAYRDARLDFLREPR
jgi:START domain